MPLSLPSYPPRSPLLILYFTVICRMDTAKCYKITNNGKERTVINTVPWSKKMPGDYLGKFVKTENSYPDGSMMSGITTHTFQGFHEGLLQEIKITDGRPGGTLENYEETECVTSGGMRKTPKRRRNNIKKRKSLKRNRTR